jgi:hypothetical protein
MRPAVAFKGLDDYLHAVEVRPGGDPAKALSDLIAEAKPLDDLESCLHAWDPDLDALPPRQEFALYRAVPTPGVTLVVGPTQTGKTTWLAGLAAFRARGGFYLGRAAGPGGRKTIIFSAEDGPASYRRNLSVLRKHYAWTGDQFQVVLDSVLVFHVRKLDFRLVRQPRTGVHEIDEGLIERMARIVIEAGGESPLAIVETVSRIGSGEDNEAAAALIRSAERLSEMAQAAVVLAHHAGKGTPRGDAYSGRGASAFADNADSVIDIAYGTDDHAKKLLGSTSLPALGSGNRLVAVEIRKCKGGGGLQPAELFELKGYSRADLGDVDEASRNDPVAAVFARYSPTPAEADKIREHSIIGLRDAVVTAVRAAEERGDLLSKRRFTRDGEDQPMVQLPNNPTRQKRQEALRAALECGQVVEVAKKDGRVPPGARWKGGGKRLIAGGPSGASKF